MLITQNVRHFEFFFNIGQEAGPFSKNISKISYFQISQELIILGKKQRVDINWQKIPYKKGHTNSAIFFQKLHGTFFVENFLPIYIYPLFFTYDD